MTLLFLLIPALLAFAAIYTKGIVILFVALVWSAPFSIYINGSPSVILKPFSLTPIIYFLSFITLVIAKNKNI